MKSESESKILILGLNKGVQGVKLMFLTFKVRIFFMIKVALSSFKIKNQPPTPKDHDRTHFLDQDLDFLNIKICSHFLINFGKPF